MNRSPLQVMPQVVAEAVKAEGYWFVIGGQAVRCFNPYRPTHDVDFGVTKPSQIKRLLAQLASSGKVEVLERSVDTVHLNFEGVDVSIFVLPHLGKHVSGQALTLTGLLATKAHAILDRGARRDFMDLYVLLQSQQLGLSEVLHALAEVYQEAINQSLFLRAFSYFDDAEGEARLPGEGPSDFEVVKEFFARAVGALVVPPRGTLTIQTKRVAPNGKANTARSVTQPSGRAKAPKKRN